MNRALARGAVAVVAASLLQWPLAQAAPGVAEKVELRAYVNEACIVADEPFFIADADQADADQKAKFLPLLGLVVGKLAELFINHELQASASGLKARAARKDTRYAASKQMNLYRVDFAPEPALSLNARLGCMTIVAAAFAPDTSDCTGSYIPKALAPESRGRPQREWKTSRTDDSLENLLRRANICVEGKARAVYEARFEFSADGTAYRLKDAGYRVESLLTTQEQGATRDTVYTLKVSAPTATDQQQVLSSAWVGLGALKAGARGNGSNAGAAPWLQVPPLSPDARRLYDQKTKVHQEVMGEIDALKRALTRNERMLAGLDQRIPTASPDVAQGLRETRTKLAVQVETQRAELDARNAEYEDLPHTPLELMPVAIEVAVTETESAQKSQLALADLIGSQSAFVASTVGSAATGLFSKAVNVADIKTDPDASEPSTDLERARARYFDALVEVQTSPGGAAGANAVRELAQARDDYNGLRASQGLEPIMAADPGPQEPSTLLSNQQIEQALQQSRTPAAPTRGLHRMTQPAPEPSVSLNIAFEYNSSDLKPQAYTQLAQLQLALSSAALRQDRIMVAGHTDAKGDPQYNQRLSLRRAEAVRNYLIANGLDARRLQAVGYGSDQPLTPDHPDDPRNRRVEIRDLGEMPP